jgi:cytochrome d ubiquinol oxidase subunit II
MHVASLNTSWFALLGLLWAGYFVLEGFDFGVALLVPLVSRDDLDRRLCINTIGPAWDANEVWLIVAAGATFAAFPTWYATMFSAFYLPMIVILLALIVRGVSFEFRGKGRTSRWKGAWDKALFWGSLVPAVLWGLAFTDLLHGLDIAAGPSYRGGLGGLFQPVALLGGVVCLALFSLHGALFLSAKTTADLAARARRVVHWLGVPTLALVAGLVAWLWHDASPAPHAAVSGSVPLGLGALAVAAVALAWGMSARHHDVVAFSFTAAAILSLVAALFSALFPRVMVSSVPGDSLTIWSSASAHETLFVMTVVAVIFTPFVLAYQAWSFWIFRKRLTRPPQVRPRPPVGKPAAGGSAVATPVSPGMSAVGEHQP